MREIDGRTPSPGHPTAAPFTAGPLLPAADRTDADCIAGRAYGTARVQAGQDDGELTDWTEWSMQVRCVAPSRLRGA